MKSCTRVHVLYLCALLCCSCSIFSRTSPAGSPSGGVSFKEKAIIGTIKGDPQLNLYQSRPHPVYLCLFQLKDPNGFNQLIEDKSGLEKLMECGHFDGTVAYTKRLVIQPGQEIVETEDRAEGARFLGVVAGYFDLRKEHVVRLSPIPKSKLKLTLELGPREILNMKVK